MYMLKRIGGLLSLAVLAGLLLSMGASPVVVAHGDIVSEFDLVENPALVDPITGTAEGHGVFNLDGRDLDNLKYDLEIEAQGLESHTWYYLSVTVRENFDGGAVPVAIAVAGMARTDNKGNLEFVGHGVLPNVFAPNVNNGVKTWRIDQQIKKLGSGEKGTCVECILVCSPTTKVELVQGSELVSFEE